MIKKYHFGKLYSSPACFDPKFRMTSFKKIKQEFGYLFWIALLEKKMGIMQV
jgi:hypothetical protein